MPPNRVNRESLHVESDVRKLAPWPVLDAMEAATLTQARDHQKLEGKLAQILGSYDSRPDTNELCFALSSPKREWKWKWPPSSAGRQYFIASTTKLYVTAIVMQLADEGRVDLDVPAARYLAPSVMEGIHILDGVDSGERITVRELLSHTSGIADYFEQSRQNGRSQFKDALGQDFGWSFEDVLRITREQLRPKFAPSASGKAFYSDTNYQILGALIEAITGTSFEEAVQERVIRRLGLTGTYPFNAETMHRYSEVAAMLNAEKRVHIPKAMASVRADGGIVSTARDGISFLEAFMGGELFPLRYLEEMQRSWLGIFPPLQYGVGIMRFALPWYYSPLQPVPPMIGHSGASGAVLFYVPDLDLYISGTVNQVKKRSLSYRLMPQLVIACQSAWRTAR